MIFVCTSTHFFVSIYALFVTAFFVDVLQLFHVFFVIPLEKQGVLQYNMSVTFKMEVMEGIMKTKDELPDCPVATTVSLIGNKWKLLILRNLLVRPWRFNELHKSLDGISQKVLTESLRQMEADGIITRTVYPEIPPRVEYALSELGESMRPILDSMQAWGNNYKASLSK